MKERKVIKRTTEITRNNKKIFCLLLIMVISVMAIGVTETNAATYYVAPDGSDSSDGSIDSPWVTIRYAVSNSGPGDTVMLRAGTYDEGDLWIRGPNGHGGAPGQYWTLQAYPGEEAIITNSIGIEANYVRIKDLHFVTPKGTISITDGYGYGHYVEILDNLFTGDNRTVGAIQVIGSDTLVEGNTINFTSQGGRSTDHGIYIMAGKAKVSQGGTFTNSNTIVRNNIILNPAGWGIHVYDEYKKDGDLHRVIENLVIENNYIANAVLRGGIILGTGWDTEIKGAIVRNNILVNNATDGIFFGLAVDDVKIYNNTIYNSINSGINIAWPATNIEIKNNIISAAGSYHISNGGNSPTVTVDNNLYWPGSPKLSNVTDSNPLTGDPLFVNPGTDDFHLQSGSAAIDTGVYLVDVPTDKDGNPRPMDGDNDGTAEYDIGAYEYTGVSCSYSVSPPTIKPFGSSGGGSAGVSSCIPTVAVPIGHL